MKIIEIGNEWTREVHCNYKEENFTCGCTFEVNFYDLKKEEHLVTIQNSVSFFDKTFFTFYILCPNCGRKIEIENPPQNLFLNKLYKEYLPDDMN